MKRKFKAVDPHALTDDEIIIIGDMLKTAHATARTETARQSHVVTQFVSCADGIIAARVVAKAMGR